MRSLRARLILLNALVLLTLFGALGIILPWIVRASMIASVDRELMFRTEMASRRPPEGGRGPRGMPDNVGPRPFGTGVSPNNSEPDPNRRFPPGQPHSTPPSQLIEGIDLRPLVIGLDGRVLTPGVNPQPWDEKAFRAAVSGQAQWTYTEIKEMRFRVLSRPLLRQGQVSEVVQAMHPLQEVERAMSGVSIALLWLSPFALLCAIGGSALLTRRALQPVQQIAATAEKIGAQEDLSRRLKITGEDEFAHLSETFNGMLTRLQKSFDEQRRLIEQQKKFIDQQKRFTADASHELKTPLAIIKANTSLALSGSPTAEECLVAIREIDEAASAMTRLTQDLLILARSDAGRLGQNREKLPVINLFQNALHRVSVKEGASVQIHIEPDGLCVEGNEEELTRVLVNLIENAQRYTPPEGSITLSAYPEGDRVHLEVRDTGIGIAPEHLPHLGERFYRVDTSRTRPSGGTGLGLSICKSIIEAHHGTLRIESAPGEGTVVKMNLRRL